MIHKKSFMRSKDSKPKSVIIAVPVPAVLKKKIKAKAKRGLMSMSQYVRNLLMVDLEG